MRWVDYYVLVITKLQHPLINKSQSPICLSISNTTNFQDLTMSLFVPQRRQRRPQHIWN